MRTFRFAIHGAMAVTWLTGCGDPAGPAPNQTLSVRSAPPVLILENSGDRPVYFDVFEREYITTALILFGACREPDTCARVDPGKTVQVPFDAITGYQPGKAEAAVYWWYLVPAEPDGFQPDSIRQIFTPF